MMNVKGIVEARKKYNWKHAWRFKDIEKFDFKFNLFFQIEEDKLIRVIRNKGGFKHFGGYSYTQEKFIDF
ncbi:hypothetical protein KS664_003072 [Clostridium perfringens]|nr:hypothetical protein [Clostridium perfringens]